jgi:hypothetical protein
MRIGQRPLLLSAMLLCLSSLTVLAQKSAPVTVTNTTANPVPTVATGTTTISGTVGISGTPTVTLGAGATVAISPSTTVNSTDTVARNIVRLVGVPSGIGGATTSSYLDVAGSPSGAYGYAVPSGKRLVINSGVIKIDSQNSPPTGFQPSAWLQPFQFSSNTVFGLFLPLPLQQQPDGSYIATLPGPIYLDQNFPLVLQINANQNWSSRVFLQGYLVDCGTGCTQQ